MKKILLALFAMALIVAFTAPAYAAMGASFKYSGFFRIRAITGNNGDRNEDLDDSAQGMDALTRPRFTATTDGGKIWALWEIDWYEDGNANAGAGANANANILVGRTGGRVGVGTNRWVVDFAVPGSALRARWGRTDYTSPDKEIFDSAGGTRWPGVALYGKLSKNMSLSVFATRRGMSGAGRNIGPEDSNNDTYYFAVGWKASPSVTVTPWVAMARDGEGRALTYAAANAKAKMGIVSLDVTSVSVSGDSSATEEGSGWALLLRASAGLGKLKLMGKLTMLSGDDNAGDNEEGRFSHLMPGGGQFRSGIMVTDRSDTIGITSFRARLPGNGGTRNTRFQNLNGAIVLGGEAAYSISKTLSLHGSVHIYNSAEESTGTDLEDPDAVDYGTELNAGFKWKIYPKLELRTAFAYLTAGDYGKVNDEDLADSWTAMVSLRHGF